MPTSYLTLARFKVLTSMPPEHVDAIEARTAGWTLANLELCTAWLEARLRKRYDIPFLAPIPLVVEGWITKIVTREAYKKRGFDPTDRQGATYESDRKEALDEVKEAADSDKGLFDLPLRADTTGSAVTQGAPHVYSEQSPYVFTDVQADIGHNEDTNRRGTFS